MKTLILQTAAKQITSTRLSTKRVTVSRLPKTVGCCGGIRLAYLFDAVYFKSNRWYLIIWNVEYIRHRPQPCPCVHVDGDVWVSPWNS